MKYKILFGLAVSTLSLSISAASWEKINENQNTEIFVDNESMISTAQSNTVEYRTLQLAKRDIAPTYLNQFKMVAHVIDDCVSHTQRVLGIKMADAASQVVKNSEVTYKNPVSKAINLESQVGKAHIYVCDMLDRYKASQPVTVAPTPTVTPTPPNSAVTTPIAIEPNLSSSPVTMQSGAAVASTQADLPLPTPEATKPSTTKKRTTNTQSSNQGMFKNEIEDESHKLLKFEKENWTYLDQNEKARIFIEPNEIKFNERTKRVTFFSKIESYEFDNKALPFGSYLVSQEVADCVTDEGARLYSALYSITHKKEKEQRFNGANIKFKKIDFNTLNSKAAKYACDLKMASISK
jgi:hypothetical protein